jgi:hypothetical protein
MSRVLSPFILISSCVVFCPKALADEKKPPATPDPPTTLDVRLVDMDGKTVEGAYVSTFVDFAVNPRDSAADETGWRYYPKVVSDRDGMGRLADKYGIDCVVARHVGRKLVAIQSVKPEQSKGVVTVMMHPDMKRGHH